MKIFNWIHAHQFSRNAHSSNVSLNGDGSSSGQVRRSGSPIGKANAERKPLLKQEDVNVQGQSWEFEGILTIGTLAIDPLNTSDDHDDHKDNDVGQVLKQSYINDYDDLDSHNNEMLLQDSQCEIKMCNLSPPKQSDVEMKCNKESMDVIDGEIVQAKMEKRVTLLDLFLADQLEEKIVEEAKPADDDDSGEDQNVPTKKTDIFYTKLGGKKAKKVAPNGHDDSRRPMKKMQRFVTRMMKKKIHPDMEARMEKKAQGKLNGDVPLGIDGLGANESAASLLLPMNQGIMV